MTTFSLYSFRIFKTFPYINFKKFFGRILAPPSRRRPGAAAPFCPPPRYATGPVAGLERMTTGSAVSALPYLATQVEIKLHMGGGIYNSESRTIFA